MGVPRQEVGGPFSAFGFLFPLVLKPRNSCYASSGFVNQFMDFAMAWFADCCKVLQLLAPEIRIGPMMHLASGASSTNVANAAPSPTFPEFPPQGFPVGRF